MKCNKEPVYYNISEIFGSIEGEGKRTGELTTFIRFYGCNLRCSWCDSSYSYTNNDYTKMTLQEIITKVKEIGYRNITITGGEPLIQPDIQILINTLCSDKYYVNIETNGSVDISTSRFVGYNNLFFTMDYKCPSSNMNSHMLLQNYKALNKNDVVKFVVADTQDLDKAYAFIKDLKYMYNMANTQEVEYPLFYISPVFNKIELKDIVQYMKDKNMEGVRLQVQLHKIIWDPDKRGV